MNDFKFSQRLFDEAKKYIPGGVNSPVRAFKAVGGDPLFIKKGKGSRIFDEDGNEFIDYVCSWGALILGHSHPRIVESTRDAIELGTSFGTPTEVETILARMICDAMPSIEKVRFVNSGTAATMSAIRLARAATGRDKIVKFAGCYHGHSDGLLAQAGSGIATLGIPSCPGVPASYSSQTLVVPYNNLESAEKIFSEVGQDIAAVILEPIAANMGVVHPQPGFLESLRDLTRDSGSLLIFDEVITGFRVGYGGAQALFGITPDLTCLGKIIGGGLPVGAFGGRQGIMDRVAPDGSVYQAGTHSGNPVVMTAGIETLKALNQPDTYEQLEEKASLLENGIVQAVQGAGIDLQVSRAGSMFTLFFSKAPVKDYDTALDADTKLYARFFLQMLSQGIYLPPSQFEANFLSCAHTDQDIKTTLQAAEKAIMSIS